jgi:hypothetical protein
VMSILLTALWASLSSHPIGLGMVKCKPTVLQQEDK